MKRNQQLSAGDTAPSSAENHQGVPREWVTHLRQRRALLREEWIDLSAVNAVADLQGGIEEAEHLLGHRVVKIGVPAGDGAEFHASPNSQTT